MAVSDKFNFPMRLVTGDEVGLIKVISFTSTYLEDDADHHVSRKLKSAVKIGKEEQMRHPVIMPLTAIDRQHEVLLLAFPSSKIVLSDQSQPGDFEHRTLVIAACKSGLVRVIDVESGDGVHEFQAFRFKLNSATGQPILDSRKRPEEYVGLYEAEGVIVTCTSFGNLSFHRLLPEGSPYSISQPSQSATHFTDKLPSLPYSHNLELDNLRRFRIFPGAVNYFATGGDERDLCVWQLNAKQEDGSFNITTTWKAKNVKNDKLDLRVPVHITDLQFLNPTADKPSKIVAVSKYHHFRVYDLNREGRRPSLSVEIGQNPFSLVEIVNHEREAIVADNVGTMLHIDIATGKMVGSYRGNSGAVKNVKEIAATSHVAAAGMDRFVRIFERDGQRRLVKKVYLKQRLNTMLFDASHEVEEEARSSSKTGTSKTKESKSATDGDADDNDDTWWDQLEVGADEEADDDEPEVDVKPMLTKRKAQRGKVAGSKKNSGSSAFHTKKKKKVK